MEKSNIKAGMVLLAALLPHVAAAQEIECLPTGGIGFMARMNAEPLVRELVEQYLLDHGYVENPDGYVLPGRPCSIRLEDSGGLQLNIYLPRSLYKDFDGIALPLQQDLQREFDAGGLNRRVVMIISKVFDPERPL